MEPESYAAWYADPHGRHAYRWWSGTCWTEHVADGGQVALDPLDGSTTNAIASTPSAVMPTAAPAPAPAAVAPPPAVAPYPAAGGPSHPQPPAPAGKSKRKRLGIIGVGVVTLALAMGGLIVVARGILDFDSGLDDDDDVAATQTVTIDSMSDGTITGADGARVLVPAGAVPLSVSGEPGSIAFSVATVDDLGAVDTSNLPDGVSIGETVYEFGPTGQSFDAPVTIEIPLAAGIDPAAVGGLAYFNEATRMWQQVTGTVDVQTNVVRGSVMHFSRYAYWFSRDPATQEAAELANGGYISVTNEAIRPYGWDSFPHMMFDYEPPKFNQTSTGYGVCIDSWTLDDPAYESHMSWIGDGDRALTVQASVARMGWAELGGTEDFWMPAGTYNLVEVWHPSEVNWAHDPFYVPHYGSAYRPYGSVTIEPGSTISFVEEERVSNVDTDWTIGRQPCLGEPMASLGSGDVQVSLTWPENGIDLDLHVIDPSGEEIFYGDRTAASGGQLDSDNRSGGGIAENIFWGDTAPRGEYKVRVNYFGGSGPANWTVSLVVDGTRRTFSGTLNRTESVDVITFRVN